MTIYRYIFPLILLYVFKDKTHDGTPNFKADNTLNVVIDSNNKLEVETLILYVDIKNSFP